MTMRQPGPFGADLRRLRTDRLAAILAAASSRQPGALLPYSTPAVALFQRTQGLGERPFQPGEVVPHSPQQAM
jgi:hypothetical protein